jgi:hypothetical protein
MVVSVNTLHSEPVSTAESSHSAVSWAAIIGGAFVAASTSLILLTLGTGLGLSSVSPWANSGASAKALGVAAIVWLIATQLISAGLGGFLAGRLRTRWVGVHTDEVFFRDTAHGFLVWAVGAVLSASILASAAGSAITSTTQVAATAVGAGGGAAAMAASHGPGRDRDRDAGNPTDYFTDMLLRTDSPSADQNSAATHMEISRIMLVSASQGGVSNDDKNYLVHVVAARTGLSQADAEQRVNTVINQAAAAKAKAEAEAKQAADDARKAGAKLSLWLFISLLAGAFFASLAATIGGRTRDQMAVVHGVA